MFAGQILQPIYSSNDALIDLIESFKSKKNETDPNFVSAFVKAVVQGCIYCTEVNGDTFYKVDSKRLESKCAVIAKYCYDDKEKEAKCLYALQQLAEELEHPSKLLSTIFTTLHDQNVISSEAFLQWESTNTMSQGKAVAALTVRKFLTWLKEGEEDQSDFLNLFQSAPESMKPLTLSKSDVINDILVSKREPNEWYSSHSNAGFGLPADEFLPHFIHNPSRNNQNQRSSSQRQIHLRPSQQDRTVRKIISLSPTQGVKLHTVDNAWKPATKGTESSDEEAKTSELLKAFRSILNKLTPRKYQNLLEEVKKFTIDTEVRLQGILELIFDKAVNEPALCLLCANLCKHLALSLKEANIGSDENGIDKKFTPLLLTRCQKEFESKMYEGIDVEEKQAIIDETTDEEKRKMLRAELDEEKRKARKRSLGNIRLIGELYLLGMLKANIMMSCVERLLRENEEESLECLCTLLMTIGSKLECEVNEFEIKKGLKKDSVFSSYINALFEFISENRISERVRFMIQDVLDIRINNWKARKIQDENKPKTIDEIQHSGRQPRPLPTFLCDGDAFC